MQLLSRMRALLRDEGVDDLAIGEVPNALATLTDREALPYLRAFLRDKRVGYRARGEVAKALATLQDREALPDLRAFFRDMGASDWVRRASLHDRDGLWKLAQAEKIPIRFK